ncbi:hypothetical protein SDC9_128667 [bioreactor metagenome]|uniref:Uncharacterized protein n=1 Tax=bioreactor metagenome TaxID=1076179 RepID=A0A645CXI0_9ZZZZ
MAKGQLPIGKGPRPGKACGNMAIGLAAYAMAYLAFGTATVFNSLSFFYQQNALLAAFFQHFQGCKNARRTRAHNNNILLHNPPP